MSVIVLSSIMITIAVLCSHCVTGIPLTDFYSFGATVNDDFLPSNDDYYSPVVNLSMPFPFFDERHESVFVNNNGYVSFTTTLDLAVPDPFPLSGFRHPVYVYIQVIAPYWADVDTGGTGTVWYRETTDPELLDRAREEIQMAFISQGSFSPSSLFIATWDHVGYYDEHTDLTNTFQCVMVTNGLNSFIIFLYADGEIQWTTGDNDVPYASGGFGGTPAQAGFNAGDGICSATVPGSRTADIINITDTSNVGVPGMWVFRVDKEDTAVGGCSPEPQALSSNSVQQPTTSTTSTFGGNTAESTPNIPVFISTPTQTSSIAAIQPTYNINAISSSFVPLPGIQSVATSLLVEPTATTAAGPTATPTVTPTPTPVLPPTEDPSGPVHNVTGVTVGSAVAIPTATPTPVHANPVGGSGLIIGIAVGSVLAVVAVVAVVCIVIVLAFMKWRGTHKQRQYEQEMTVRGENIISNNNRHKAPTTSGGIPIASQAQPELSNCVAYGTSGELSPQYLTYDRCVETRKLKTEEEDYATISELHPVGQLSNTHPPQHAPISATNPMNTRTLLTEEDGDYDYIIEEHPHLPVGQPSNTHPPQHAPISAMDKRVLLTEEEGDYDYIIERPHRPVGQPSSTHPAQHAPISVVNPAYQACNNAVW